MWSIGGIAVRLQVATDMAPASLSRFWPLIVVATMALRAANALHKSLIRNRIRAASGQGVSLCGSVLFALILYGAGGIVGVGNGHVAAALLAAFLLLALSEPGGRHAAVSGSATAALRRAVWRGWSALGSGGIPGGAV